MEETWISITENKKDLKKNSMTTTWDQIKWYPAQAGFAGRITTSSMQYDNLQQTALNAQNIFCERSACDHGCKDWNSGSEDSWTCKNHAPTAAQTQCPANAPRLSWGFTDVYSGDKYVCSEFPLFYHNWDCYGHYQEWCGTFDYAETTTLGSAVASPGANPQVQGTTFDVDDIYKTSRHNVDQPNKGWALVGYQYDFSNYSINDVLNGPIHLTNWVRDIFTKTGKGIPDGMNAVLKTRVRDGHVLYGIILDYYNQMYNEGIYNTIPNYNTTFLNTKIITNGFVRYRDLCIGSVIGYLGSDVYPPYGVIPEDFLTVIQTVLQPPRPEQLPNNVYVIHFSLGWDQYYNYQQSSDKTSYLNTILSNMLRDRQGSMSNSVTREKWAPADPTLENPTEDSYTIVQLWDNTQTPAYGTKVVAPTDYDQNWATSYPNYIFGTAQITATVKTWSPMLAVYFQKYAGASFDPATCAAIAHPATSQYPETLPTSCYKNDCVVGGDCKTDLINYCQMNYVPPLPELRTTTDDFLMGVQFAPSCKCYASALAPISNPTPGNIGAMCFDKYCNPELRSLFKIDDAVCAKHCDEVYRWVTGQGADQPRNANDMDWQRFNAICGTNYRPYTADQWNTSVLFTGGLSSMLLTLLGFTFAQRKNWARPKVIIFVIVILLLSIGTTVFLARDLAGKAECNGKVATCTSKITKMRLPKEFCAYQQQCECSFDQDCPNGCLCASSACQPQGGVRNFKTIKTRNIPLIIMSLIVCVLFFITSYSLYKTEKWKMNKILFTIIIGICGLLPCLFVLLKTNSETVFTDTCQAGGTCKTDEDCQAGATCIQGKCQIIPSGCPVPNPVPIPTDTMGSGTYTIQFAYNSNTYLYLYPATQGPLILAANFANVWQFDAKANSLSSTDLKTGAICMPLQYDMCNGSYCANTVYSADKNSIASQPRFLLCQGGRIYSVDAQAYIIPAVGQNMTCTQSPCASGDCFQANGVVYVTYTTDISRASMWLITPCDPKTTCNTTCGVCPPSMVCNSSSSGYKCEPITNLVLKWYATPDFSDAVIRWSYINGFFVTASDQLFAQHWSYNVTTGKLLNLELQMELKYVTAPTTGLTLAAIGSGDSWTLTSDNRIFLTNGGENAWIGVWGGPDPHQLNLPFQVNNPPSYQAIPVYYQFSSS